MMRLFLPKGQWPHEQAALDDNVLRRIGSFLTQNDLSALAHTCKSLNLLFNTPPYELGHDALTIWYVQNKAKQLIGLERNALNGGSTDYAAWRDNYNHFGVLELAVRCMSNQCPKLSDAEYAIDLSFLFIGYLIFCMTSYDEECKKWQYVPKPSPVYPPIDIHQWHRRYVGNSQPTTIELKDLMLFMGRFVISSDDNIFMNRAILTTEDYRFRSCKHFFPHFAKKANEIETLIHATRKLHEALYAAAPSISRTPG